MIRCGGVMWLCVMMLAPMTASGDDALKLHLTTSAARPRTGAMLPIEARFIVNTPDLVRGRLHLHLMDSHQWLQSFTSTPLALTRGEQVVHITLPPFNAGNIDGTVQAHATFQREGSHRGNIDLGIIALPAPTWHSRNTTMLISDPWLGSVQRNVEQVRALRLDNVEPRETVQIMQQRVSTLPVRDKPETIPDQAIGYCAYDLVVLIDEGFTELSQRQLDAIIAWVEAGGSVYVAPPTKLAARHNAFLHHLRTGRNDSTYELPHGASAYRLQLGRAVIFTEQRNASDETFLYPDWRNVVAFLWKLTFDQRGDVASDGKWSLKRQIYSNNAHPFARNIENASDLPPLYHPTSAPSEPQIINTLQPRAMRMVPFHLIVATLVGYVLLIGPIDYFVLSKLRLRKLTWVTFPVITIAVTVAAIAMTNHYMGRNDHRRQLVIIDVSSADRELRRTTIELAMLGRSQQITEQANASLISQPNLNRISYYAGNTGATAHTTPLSCVGRFPQQYTMTRHVAQWSPNLLRTTTIAPKPLDADVDWSNSKTINPAEDNESHSWLHQMTAKPLNGYFSIVSQTSPTGGPCLEDLAIVDATDQHQQYRIVWMERDNNIYLYRQLQWKDDQ